MASQSGASESAALTHNLREAWYQARRILCLLRGHNLSCLLESTPRCLEGACPGTGARPNTWPTVLVRHHKQSGCPMAKEEGRSHTCRLASQRAAFRFTDFDFLYANPGSSFWNSDFNEDCMQFWRCICSSDVQFRPKRTLPCTQGAAGGYPQLMPSAAQLSCNYRITACIISLASQPAVSRGHTAPRPMPDLTVARMCNKTLDEGVCDQTRRACLGRWLLPARLAASLRVSHARAHLLYRCLAGL